MAFIPIYILILFVPILVDYVAARKLENNSGLRRKTIMLFAVFSTCSVLFLFKYYDFFAWNVNEAAMLFHSDFTISALHIILPIGLSFHTFQSLSYVIEVYRGKQKAEKHLGIYAVYVMFFPQLVAGPIERPQNLLHQFKEKHNFSYDDVATGLRFFLWGLFQKVVIADTLRKFVSPVYASPDSYSGEVLIVATFFFSFQVFCDFSGYSLMARGIARVFGFRLMLNFDRPYLASSLTDFWRRWHISLSSWLRDYVFNPIAMGLRNLGVLGVVLSFLVTFFISGLWHGAHWHFVIWGLLHGSVLSLEIIFSKQIKKARKAIPNFLYGMVMIPITFSFVTFTYIFFRAESFPDSLLIADKISSCLTISKLKHFIDGGIESPVLKFLESAPLAGINRLEFQGGLCLIAFLVVVQCIQSYVNVEAFLNRVRWWVRWPIYQIGVLSVIFLGAWSEQNNFIYFQF